MIGRIEKAVEEFNSSRPAQRWAVKRHRNGILFSRGDEKNNIPDDEVFVYPETWRPEDSFPAKAGIRIMYTTSVTDQCSPILSEVSLLHDFFPQPEIVKIWLREWGQSPRYMLRIEVDEYLEELQDRLSRAVKNYIS